MTVFKTFIKVLKKSKAFIILYTLLLVFFGSINFVTNDDAKVTFEEEKPSIFIVNKDENKGVTKNLIKYMENNSEIVDLEEKEDKIDDSLFNREANYIIYIPKGYREDFLNGKNPKIEIKRNGNSEATYAEMLLNKYLKVANAYQVEIKDENKLISKINSNLKDNVKVNITDKEDKSAFYNATFFYNFSNYSIMAGLIFVVCFTLFSFRREPINKRTIVSSINYKKLNRQLLLSSSIYALILWFSYVVFSFILIGNAMISLNGICYVINSLIFTICSLTLAFLISNLVTNKNAISGLVNIIAIGSSFICGSFVPVELLPDGVKNIGRILPSYYFIQNNQILKSIKVETISDLSDTFGNVIMMFVYIIIFILLANMISKRKRKIG